MLAAVDGRAIGTSVVMLSATLPSLRRAALGSALEVLERDAPPVDGEQIPEVAPRDLLPLIAEQPEAGAVHVRQSSREVDRVDHVADALDQLAIVDAFRLPNGHGCES